ncbi:MAG: ABC transporter ATP-binding protein [Micavibrio sp.]|nr:ABC transporter ATP-binding protein [Micavibrio sp.]HCK32689.1 ABC transporter ATP-binding protein [Rhodospirillaceae bacterium]|tara:strand:+ start:98 stop:856 length:759 start_codon:yes stop_codon:yes gene_type:complete
MKNFKIEMQGVKKSFGSKDVLRNVNLDVKKGESLVIIGGSGTGKSVTIKTILGLIKPDAGKILVDGQDVTNLGGNDRDEYLKKFGMLFQGGALFDSMTIWENVAFGLTQGQKMSKKEAYPIAIEKLEAVGLKESIAQHYPAELSGGMQKRVSLARAIARNPEIIFFDEPTTGLDPIMADVINDLIRKCVSELGATAVSITHDMASVRKIADSVAMIYEGEIIWHGPIEKLDNSGNEYVDQFINGRAEGPVKF